MSLSSASASASASAPALEFRGRIVAGLEAVLVDVREIIDRGLAALVGGAVGDPERREIALAVERFDAGAVLAAAEQAVEFAGAEFAQLVGDTALFASAEAVL